MNFFGIVCIIVIKVDDIDICLNFRVLVSCVIVCLWFGYICECRNMIVKFWIFLFKRFCNKGVKFFRFNGFIIFIILLEVFCIILDFWYCIFFNVGMICLFVLIIFLYKLEGLVIVRLKILGCVWLLIFNKFLNFWVMYRVVCLFLCLSRVLVVMVVFIWI